MFENRTWSTFYDLTMLCKLKQSTLGILTGSPEFQISQAETFEHTNTCFNRCSTGASLRSCAQPCPLCWSTRSVKWKLETLKHFFNRRSTGANLCTCARYCPLTWVWACLTNFTSEGFLIETLQLNPTPWMD